MSTVTAETVEATDTTITTTTSIATTTTTAESQSQNGVNTNLKKQDLSSLVRIEYGKEEGKKHRHL